MRWTLKQGRARVTPRLLDHIDRRLGFALARFGSRIARVVIALEDLNGPRGGIDKACRIVVRLKGGGEVVASVEDVDWEVAIDRATTRVGHTVGRDVSRARDTRRIRPALRSRAVGGAMRATAW